LMGAASAIRATRWAVAINVAGDGTPPCIALVQRARMWAPRVEHQFGFPAILARLKQRQHGDHLGRHINNTSRRGAAL